jgi:hypothetical protein
MVALSLAATAACRDARAQVSAQAQESFGSTTTLTRDEVGNEVHSSTQQWDQRFRLSLDQQLYPLVTAGAIGTLDWSQAWLDQDGVRRDLDSKTWGLNANVKAGDQILNGAANYDYRGGSSEERFGALSTTSPSFVRERVGGAVSWHPVDLPTLDLQGGRSSAYDPSRRLLDLTSDDALLALRDRPIRPLDVYYSLQYSDQSDRIGGVETTAVVNSGGATYADDYLARRGSAYLSYTVTGRNSDVSTFTGGGGTVATPVLPLVGLSIVEAFPATPDRVTLNPNAALNNGDTATSAGLNIGFGPTVAGDTAYRDMGGQFVNATTAVNTIRVWVDRSLPGPIWATFIWSAWRSDDNVTWTQIPLQGAPAFSPFESRFEIPIQETRARFLKVVTRPLGAAVTVDAQYRGIFVTEVQFFELVAASKVIGHSSSFGQTFNGTNRLVLLADPDLRHDISVSLAQSTPGTTAWSVLNGLSLSRRLSPTTNASSRVDRTDSNFGNGHEAQTRWSAALSYDPLPTLGGAVSYNGQYAESLAGGSTSNGFGAVAHADLYQGVLASGNAGYTIGTASGGRTSRTTNLVTGLSLVPNRILTMSLGASYSTIAASGGGQPSTFGEQGALSVALSLSPFPTLALSGGASRTFAVPNPTTFANFAASYSPFISGALALRLTYIETIETATSVHTKATAAGVRWNIRIGWYLDVGYNWLYNGTPAVTDVTQGFMATLVVTAR